MPATARPAELKCLWRGCIFQRSLFVSEDLYRKHLLLHVTQTPATSQLVVKKSSQQPTSQIPLVQVPEFKNPQIPNAEREDAQNDVDSTPRNQQPAKLIVPRSTTSQVPVWNLIAPTRSGGVVGESDVRRTDNSKGQELQLSRSEISTSKKPPAGEEEEQRNEGTPYRKTEPTAGSVQTSTSQTSREEGLSVLDKLFRDANRPSKRPLDKSDAPEEHKVRIYPWTISHTQDATQIEPRTMSPNPTKHMISGTHTSQSLLRVNANEELLTKATVDQIRSFEEASQRQTTPKARELFKTCTLDNSLAEKASDMAPRGIIQTSLLQHPLPLEVPSEPRKVGDPLAAASVTKTAIKENANGFPPSPDGPLNKQLQNRAIEKAGESECCTAATKPDQGLRMPSAGHTINPRPLHLESHQQPTQHLQQQQHQSKNLLSPHQHNSAQHPPQQRSLLQQQQQHHQPKSLLPPQQHHTSQHLPQRRLSVQQQQQHQQKEQILQNGSQQQKERLQQSIEHSQQQRKPNLQQKDHFRQQQHQHHRHSQLSPRDQNQFQRQNQVDPPRQSTKNQSPPSVQQSQQQLRRPSQETHQQPMQTPSKYRQPMDKLTRMSASSYDPSQAATPYSSGSRTPATVSLLKMQSPVNRVTGVAGVGTRVHIPFRAKDSIVDLTGITIPFTNEILRKVEDALRKQKVIVERILSIHPSLYQNYHVQLNVLRKNHASSRDQLYYSMVMLNNNLLEGAASDEIKTTPSTS